MKSALTGYPAAMEERDLIFFALDAEKEAWCCTMWKNIFPAVNVTTWLIDLNTKTNLDGC